MKNSKGQILAGAVLLLTVLLILVPAVIYWVQNESHWGVSEEQTTTAFDLADAAVQRGYWEVHSSTITCAEALAGQTIAGYNFDTTYTDMPGGSYRIKISSSGTNLITVIGEGRDSRKKQVRAIQGVFENETVYSPLMAQGMISWGKGLGVYWGPIMSQGNLQLTSDYVANWYFPQLYAKGDVIGTTNNPRDTNWPLPPSTDGLTWWANYQYVPPLPVLDFAELRSSAAATNTLNVYGCKDSTPVGNWDLRSSCTSSGNHNTHFGDSYNYKLGAKNQPNNSYVWYWDGDLTLSGAYCGNSPCNESTGLYGTVIVRGNLTVDTPGEYSYVGHVPTNAWVQEQKLTKTAYDTSASGEYPADLGLHDSNSTFKFGTDSWTQPAGGGSGWVSTVGIRGFTYVGGNLVIDQFMDFNGAVWVNGSVVANNGSNTAFCAIYYNDQISLPTLNVVLVQQSWKEISPSTLSSWP